MKTAEIKLNYDFTGKDTVEIENNMAPLFIGLSESGQVEVSAELSIHSFVPGTEIGEYFNVNEDGKTLKIELEEVPELADSFLGTGRSQVWVRVPKGATVIATAEIQPISAEGLAGAMVIHNENGPIRIKDCDGHIHLENENGPIKLNGCSAEFEIKIENGPLSGEKLSGEKLEIESENGPVKIRLAAFPKVNITSENGVIFYESLPVESGEMSFVSENGVVNLVLAQEQNFELSAETNVGSISASGGSAEDASEGGLKISMENENGMIKKVIRRGESGLKISVKTENGVIKLNADGQNDMSFIKLKLKDLKGAIGSAVGPEDMDKVQKAMQGAVASVEKAVSSINEDKIKEKLAGTLDKLKKTVENFEFKETSDKVVKAVDQIGDEVTDTLKTVFRKVKEGRGEEEGHEHRHERFESGILKEHIRNAVDAAFSKAQSKGLSGREKQEVDERSRTKILEMLESGKITAEEAERLLKAISAE